MFSLIYKIQHFDSLNGPSEKAYIDLKNWFQENVFKVFDQPFYHYEISVLKYPCALQFLIHFVKDFVHELKKTYLFLCHFYLEEIILS